MATKPVTDRSAEDRAKRKRVERPDRSGRHPIEVSKLQHIRDGQKRRLPEPKPEDMVCPQCGFEGWPFQTVCPKDGTELLPRGC